MKRSILFLALGTAATLAGCPSEAPSSSNLEPFRDDWRVEAEVDFPYLDAEGVAQISRIEIGGLPRSDNFANRGDVIVKYADTDKITIELRRFTMASTEATAQEDFDSLQLWAYSESPKPPDEVDADDDCLAGGWQDDCRIRVYYDGLDQIIRSGADIRVTLPQIYKHTVAITTSDNDADSDYHNRGNVCVENLRGTADIDIGNGVAYVALGENVSPMPRCSEEFLTECWSWPDSTGGSAANPGPDAWAQECPCINAIGEFGQVKVDSHDAAAADVVVDIPGDLWAAINLTNEASGQMRNPEPDAPGARCDATVTVPGYELDSQIGDETTRDPWRNKGFLNHPSDAAIVGAGFNIQLTSKDCAPVTTTEDPSDFVGPNNGTMQNTVERGNLQVCSGCIRQQTCEQLLGSLPSVPL